MAFDIYVWKSHRDLDADRAEALLKSWQDTGSDPGTSPYEPSTDVGAFHGELMKDVPGLVVRTDAVPDPSTAPIWLAAPAEQPAARMVAISLSPTAPRGTLEAIAGLAAKHGLVLFDVRSRRVHLPLETTAAPAKTTFWTAGVSKAAVAGGLGAAIAVAAWFLGIPLLSGVLIVVGGFLLVMAVYTFINERRRVAKVRRTGA